MSELLKHECGVALVRLRKNLSWYARSCGIPDYGLEKVTLLLEKQHNRGQDGAGLAAVKFDPEPGTPACALAKSAASGSPLADLLDKVAARREEFAGNIFLGHLRYATFGKGDVSCCSPFLHDSTCLGRMLLLAGNFNFTDTGEMLKRLTASGHHPASAADGYLLLQTVAHFLEKEVNIHPDCPDYVKILRQAVNSLDGAFTICGVTGSGDLFLLRDSRGIRPGYFYFDDEVFAAASERPAIQAAFNRATSEVMELPPGKAVILRREGQLEICDCLDPHPRRSCVFERIYFSRGNDGEIHHERRALGKALVPAVLKSVDSDFDNTVFSYIPNSAQAAFHGLLEELSVSAMKKKHVIRFGQVAVKDAKFRTFITDAAHRQEIYRHVYDVTYGLVRPGSDNLVVLDDSIVRGNTMRSAILPMLDRLGPKKIVVASSAPPVKYPDCYGIDMATAGELIAFQALISLLKKNGAQALLDECREGARKALRDGEGAEINWMKKLYDAVPDEELLPEITRLLTPPELNADFEVVYQTCADLRSCCPGHTGDWYFTGDYPTPGGVTVANRALVNYFDNNSERAY